VRARPTQKDGRKACCLPPQTPQGRRLRSISSWLALLLMKDCMMMSSATDEGLHDDEQCY